MDDSVSLADIGKELVAEAFAFACALNQTCDIDDLHSCRNHALGLAHFDEFVQAVIRNGDYSDVRFYSTERKIG